MCNRPLRTVYVDAMLIWYAWPSLTVANLQPMLSQLSMLGSQVMGQSQSTSFQCWASIPDKTNPLSAFAWWASAHYGYIAAPATSLYVPDVQQRRRWANIDSWIKKHAISIRPKYIFKF